MEHFPHTHNHTRADLSHTHTHRQLKTCSANNTYPNNAIVCQANFNNWIRVSAAYRILFIYCIMKVKYYLCLSIKSWCDVGTIGFSGERKITMCEQMKWIGVENGRKSKMNFSPNKTSQVDFLHGYCGYCRWPYENCVCSISHLS